MGAIRQFKCENCGIFLSLKVIAELEFDKVYFKRCPKCNHKNRIQLIRINENESKFDVRNTKEIIK